MTTGKPSRWRQPLFWSVLALLLLGFNCAFFFGFNPFRPGYPEWSMVLLWVLVSVQAVFALVALLFGLLRLCGVGRGGMRARMLGFLAMVGALPPLYIGVLAAAFFGGGGGWGRPLRVRGRQVHPELREGTDWEHGERPDPTGLDEATRAALEGLWLHDAQKEHASVAAFARVSWLLAAVGAPPDLLRWSHRAAIEEIAHARLCFALAAGYGGRSHTVEPMPELLSAGLGLDGDAIATLVVESLGDGCLLEDFNADIAAECATVCEEPVTRHGLERIAREERSHAEFSWAVVTWLVQRDGDAVRAALLRAIDGLAGYRRPTAVSAQKHALVMRADQAALRRHGRLPDERWAELWRQRLLCTEERARVLLATCELAATDA
jgi:hypothetical protein